MSLKIVIWELNGYIIKYCDIFNNMIRLIEKIIWWILNGYNDMKNIEINEYIKFGLVMVVLYLFYNIVGIGCPIKFLTGISCAGCGMTRAWICLVNLDIKGAFYYHPLFFFPIIYFCLFLIKDKIPYKIFNCAIVIGIALFITIYILRLLNPDDIVVNINIESGFIFKFLHNGGF